MLNPSSSPPTSEKQTNNVGVCPLRAVRLAGADPREPTRQPLERGHPAARVQHQHLQPAVHVQLAALRLAHVAARPWDLPAVCLGYVLFGRRVQVYKCIYDIIESFFQQEKEITQEIRIL